MKNILIFASALFAIAILFSSTAYADIIPPNKQKKLGISNENIVCESGFFKVIRDKSNSIACVHPSSVYKLMATGWAKPVDDKLLEKYVELENKSIGTITTLSVVPVKPTQGTVKEKSTVVAYDYFFEVCAPQKIYSPTVLIRSDSDSKHYELAEAITPEKCVISVSRIKAANSDSINSTLLNKGEISKVVSDLEEKIASLKAELSETRKNLGKAPEAAQENSKQGNKIADLRKQINDSTAELHRLLFTMYSSSKTTALQKMSFSGAPIEGETATKLSATKSLSEENRYIVTFETCAANKQIRLPVVMISSDKQSVDIKLGAKISPNTCVLTTGKIIADDPQTISVAPVGNANINQIEEIESKITLLQDQLIAEKDTFALLVHNPDRPGDFKDQANALAIKIMNLRDQLISAKAEFSKIMLETYR